MKKIIVAFDGTNFSEGAFEFARKLNELSPVLLTGVFLKQAAVSGAWSYAGGVNGLYIPVMEGDESELVEKNIKRFAKLCRSNGIDYRVHEDFYDFSLPEIKKESKYADLIIIGSEKFYENRGKESPNVYLKETLHDVECPVILVPEAYDFPTSIILAFDGSEESVFAIKQFAYLFPELTSLPSVLVYADDSEEQQDFPDKIQMEELVARHFSHLTLHKLELADNKFFSTWVSEKKSSMLVSGSYGRSGLSRMFKKSFIREVIADHPLPIFIAHK